MPNVTKQNNRYRLVLAAYAATVVGILVSSFFTDLRLWGFSWYGYFGGSGRAMLLLVAAAAPLVLTKLRDDSSSPAHSDRPFLWPAIAVILVAGASFYLLRAQTHFLGDGYLLLGRLARGHAPIRPWNPGIYWIQNGLNQLLGNSGQDSALASFQIISIGSGVLFLTAAAATASRLYQRLKPRILFLLGVACGGYSLMFFGHVENYPVFVLAVGLFGLMGLLASKDKLHPLWTLIPLLAALPLHPFSAAIVPAAVYLIVRPTRFGRYVASLPPWIKASAALIVVGVIAYAFYYVYSTSYFFRFAIVPFAQNQFTVEGYTMLSWKHLLDLANLLGLLQPALLLTGVLLFWRKSSMRQPAYRFLLLMLVGSLGIAFLFDAKLGMPRDWDLFAFTGIPLVLLTLTAALDRPQRSTVTLRAVALTVTLGFLILIPRALIPATPDMSIALLDDYSRLDIYKNGGGRFLLLDYLDSHGRRAEAERRRTENASVAAFEFLDRDGQSLMRQGNIAAAMAKYHELLRDFPAYSNAWTNLGICHYQMRAYDSAVSCLRISDGLNPYNPDAYHYLALSLYASGHDEEAEERWRDVMWLRSSDYRPYVYLLLMYDYAGRTDNYETLADSVLTLAARPEAHVQLVGKATEIFLRRGDMSRAMLFGQRALQMGVGVPYICDLQKRFPEFRLIDCEN